MYSFQASSLVESVVTFKGGNHWIGGFAQICVITSELMHFLQWGDFIQCGAGLLFAFWSTSGRMLIHLLCVSVHLNILSHHF